MVFLYYVVGFDPLLESLGSADLELDRFLRSFRVMKNFIRLITLKLGHSRLIFFFNYWLVILSNKQACHNPEV